jgi:hypothetical protein
MVTKLESLLDAIALVNGVSDPVSLCYQLRNPLLLKSFAKPGRHAINTDGYREFTTLQAGLKAAQFDLELKLKGLSRAGLKSDDPLRNLLGCYGIKEREAIDDVVSFVRLAIRDETVNYLTPLKFFLERNI